ncbi:hypothetical protein R1flu_012461 [Riccia fluitans]|uniref:Uncharacterized protein n=1 Tax=Riccia fluitans TaxID=41844 RepID=A0ABD1ZBU7_9MARC
MARGWIQWQRKCWPIGRKKAYLWRQAFWQGGKSQPTHEGAKVNTAGELPSEILVDHGQAFEGACLQSFDANSTAKLHVATVHEGIKPPLPICRKMKAETNIAVVVEPLEVKIGKGSKRARMPPAKVELGFNPDDVIFSQGDEDEYFTKGNATMFDAKDVDEI